MSEKTLFNHFIKSCKICGNEKTGNHTTYCCLCYNSYRRRHYKINREKQVKRSQEYNSRNKDKFNENLKRYRKGDAYKKSRSKWNSENKDRISLYDKNKRHKRRSIKGSGTIKISEWRDLLVKCGQKCYWCKKKQKLTMDHYVPLSKGGEHNINNIVPACFSCNSSKQDLDPIKYANKIGRLF